MTSLETFNDQFVGKDNLILKYYDQLVAHNLLELKSLSLIIFTLNKTSSVFSLLFDLNCFITHL